VSSNLSGIDVDSEIAGKLPDGRSNDKRICHGHRERGSLSQSAGGVTPVLFFLQAAIGLTLKITQVCAVR